jgi:predicted dehydrogenase
MSKPLRVAVVGAGRMGRHHARTLSGLADCELVAVIDEDVDRARQLTSEYGGRALSRIDELADPIDAATVAVPTVVHADVAIPLMQRGVHVLVEKPLAQDSATARRLLEASRESDRILQVGHSERFNPVVQALIRMEVTPKFIETHRISPFTFRSADIGVVFDMMIHDIDIVLHLVRDRAYTVDAVGVNVIGEYEDVANARVRFSNGSVANMTASRLALKTERRIRVFCPTAYLSMDYQKKTGIAIKLDSNLDLIRMARERNYEDLSQMQSLDYGSMVKVEPLEIKERDALEAETTSFFESIRTGGQAAVSAEEGYLAVEMAERIIESVKRHDWGARDSDGATLANV